MPRLNVAVYTAPNFEVATCYFWKAVKHLPEYAPVDAWEIHGLEANEAVREAVLHHLREFDPAFFFGCGHGNPDVFTGQFLDHIFWTCNCRELAGRVVYLLSCLTAQRLGRDIVEKGARAYIGYFREYVFCTETPVRCRDPIAEDRHARAFFDTTLKLIGYLMSGKTVGEAFQMYIDDINRWIDYWSRQDDPDAKYIVAALTWDRDAARLYGDPTARVGSGALPSGGYGYAPEILSAILGASVGYVVTRSPTGAAKGAAIAALTMFVLRKILKRLGGGA